ncbi:MAG TPA: pantoate--beta-alanine ligase [Longimicrobiales bacterium]|nr:pantoate--beta-alanine ligase [Longimicrobiales bacterium]
MKIVRTIREVRREVAAARGEGPVVLTPTMGYFHDGHLSLMDRARSLGGLSVVSVFVNPLQFGPGEDFEAYPRDLERDAELARGRGVDLFFAPSPEEVYPDGELEVRIVPGRLAERLCGLSRPTHFGGVLTVVAKLLGMVQPDAAVFGQKDYQQVTLIRRMVRDLNFPVEVRMAPIVREEDGLAMSSRNTYLTERQREQALSLSQGLFAARALFAEGVGDPERLKARVRGIMRSADVEPEYIELVDPEELEPVDDAGPETVLAVAARVGETRLIDNLILGGEG